MDARQEAPWLYLDTNPYLHTNLVVIHEIFGDGTPLLTEALELSLDSPDPKIFVTRYFLSEIFGVLHSSNTLISAKYSPKAGW